MAIKLVHWFYYLCLLTYTFSPMTSGQKKREDPTFKPSILAIKLISSDSIVRTCLLFLQNCLQWKINVASLVEESDIS